MLERLALRNFKSFREASVPLGPLTLVVGTNASGKTNLRDALRFLHGIGLGYSLAEILGEKYGPGGILQWRGIRGGVRETPYYGSPSFEVRASLPMQDPHFQDLAAILGVEWARKALTYAITVDVTNEKRPRVAQESLCGYFDSNPHDDPLDQREAHLIRVRLPRGGRHRKHGKVSEFPSPRPVLSQFPDIQEEPRNLRRMCTALLEALSSMRFLDLDPDAMREPSQPGQVILSDRGENLSSVLEAICSEPERKASLLEWVRSLTPMDAADLDFVSDDRGRVLVHLVEASGARVSAYSASDGTLRFLALVAALLSPDTGRLFFFEEIDNGIHPTRLHLLLRLMSQACRQRQIQVIGTTHNPALLAFLDEEARKSALLVVRREGDPASRVVPIAELPDLTRILERQDLGRLHAAGWLEDAALFSEPEPVEETG
jgi:predicted ATPase